MNLNGATSVIVPDVWSKVWKLKRASWGTSTQIYKAFKMVLDACIKNQVPPAEVQKYGNCYIFRYANRLQNKCKRILGPTRFWLMKLNAMYVKYGYSCTTFALLEFEKDFMGSLLYLVKIIARCYPATIVHY